MFDTTDEGPGVEDTDVAKDLLEIEILAEHLGVPE